MDIYCYYGSSLLQEAHTKTSAHHVHGKPTYVHMTFPNQTGAFNAPPEEASIAGPYEERSITLISFTTITIIGIYSTAPSLTAAAGADHPAFACLQKDAGLLLLKIVVGLAGGPHRPAKGLLHQTCQCSEEECQSMHAGQMDPWHLHDQQ